MNTPPGPDDQDWMTVDPADRKVAASAPQTVSAPPAPQPASASSSSSSSSSSASSSSASSSSASSSASSSSAAAASSSAAAAAAQPAAVVSAACPPAASPAAAPSVVAAAPPPYNSNTLDEAFMASLFPDKEPAKRAKWLQTLSDQEFTSLADLRMLSEALWAALDLPLAVKLKLQAHTSSMNAPPPPVAPSVSLVAPPPPPITQLDAVVIDISGSMKAKTTIDPLKTREDMSKVVFHVFVDKMLGLEMNHGVGLLAFGQTSRLFPVTRNYESFQDELGRLDANQSATRLYDSIKEAGQALLGYASENKLNIVKGTPDAVTLRVFALTDGEDNASGTRAWQVAQWCQDNNIVLDSLPLAGPNKVLQAMSTATSGLCMRVVGEQQALALFEREAVLHLASREQLPAQARITSESELLALCSEDQVVEDVRVAAPVQLSKPVASKVQVESLISKSSSGVSSGAMKRVSKELSQILTEAEFPTYVSPDDVFFWRVVLPGPDATAYAGRFFLVSLQFPSDYPFKPPRVRFQTPVYHANINNDGGICLDILKDHWSPALTASKIMQSLRSLLCDPNFSDPLDAFKAQVGMTDRPRYEAEATAHAAKSAPASLDEAIARYNLA